MRVSIAEAGIYLISWVPQEGSNVLTVNGHPVATITRESGWGTPHTMSLQLAKGDLVEAYGVRTAFSESNLMHSIREALNV